MTVAERVERVERAGYNVLNLNPADVAETLDFVADVPRSLSLDAFGPEPTPAVDAGAEPPIQERATQLYGSKIYVSTLRGKGAEAVLAAVLGKRFSERGGFDVVTHGLFPTVERQLRRNGARIEVAPRAAAAGTSDISIGWLTDRLAHGRCDVVYLEPSNNGLAGWPLSLANLSRVRELCDSHRMLLILDATRIFANASMQNEDVHANARAMLALTDMYTTSCAKECFVPAGGLIAVPDHELARLCFTQAWGDGASLEPHQAQIDLARGLAYSAAHPEAFEKRRAFLERLRDALSRSQIAPLEPLGGHALFIPVDGLFEGEVSSPRVHSLEALLYMLSGIRAKIARHALLGKTMLRIAVPLGTSHDPSEVASGIAMLFREHREATELVAEIPPRHLHPRLERYRVA